MYSLLFHFYIVFITLIFAGILAIDFFNYVSRNKDPLNWDPDKHKMRKYTPRTLVMVPRKGEDFNLAENLLSLKNQNYKNYDLIAIIKNRRDPAFKSIKKTGLEYILSDRQFNKCSGKVMNLLTAMNKMKRYEVYVVADSDVEASKEWLDLLVRPLRRKEVGVSTTYPYFIPITGFWSTVKMVWNFVGNGLMESKSTRFAWGGSMAFKKLLIDKDLIDSMKIAVSDDIEITRACKRHKLNICYVNKHIAHVNTKESFDSFFEWTNRQMALFRYANRKIVFYGVAVYINNIAVIISGIILSIFYNPLFVFLFVRQEYHDFQVVDELHVI